MKLYRVLVKTTNPQLLANILRSTEQRAQRTF